MDWADERYVRVYTRDTPDLLAVGWEGRAVLWELMRKVDRAGIVDETDPAVLAELIRMPTNVVEIGLRKLVDRGVVELHGRSTVLANFIEAQEAKSSDRQRQRESRARRRDRARAAGVTSRDNIGHRVTPRDESSHDVTESNNASHDVTERHAESHGVTPSCTTPSVTVPDRARDKRARARNECPPARDVEHLPSPEEHDAEWLARAEALWGSAVSERSSLSALGYASSGDPPPPGLMVSRKVFEDCGLWDAVQTYTDEQLRHAIAVRVAECKAKRTLRYLNPAQLWGKSLTWAVGASLGDVAPTPTGGPPHASMRKIGLMQ